MSTAMAVWSYAESVATMRPLVARWKTVTVEMLAELHEAREALSKHGPRPGFVSNETNTWTGYLDDVGLAKSTVNRWLSQYDPKTGRLKLIEAPKQEPKLEESIVQGDLDESENIEDKIGAPVSAVPSESAVEEDVSVKAKEGKAEIKALEQMIVDEMFGTIVRHFKDIKSTRKLKSAIDALTKKLSVWSGQL